MKNNFTCSYNTMSRLKSTLKSWMWLFATWFVRWKKWISINIFAISLYRSSSEIWIGTTKDTIDISLLLDRNNIPNWREYMFFFYFWSSYKIIKIKLAKSRNKRVNWSYNNISSQITRILLCAMISRKRNISIIYVIWND